MTDTTTPAAPITPAAAKNDKRIKDLFSTVTKLGEESALGKDSLPKLAHAVVKAAADGAINATDKNDKGEDLAHQIYAKYAAGESKKAIHEHSAGGLKANASKIRQLISMGCMTTIDPLIVMENAHIARENMKADDEKVKSAYPFYVDVAREQLKSDKELTTEAMEKIAVKDVPSPKELEKELRAIMKKLEDLTSDGLGKDKLKDNHENIEAAFHLIKERVEGMATAKATMVLRQQAAALGLTLA